MKPFYELTRSGRSRRLRLLAEQLLRDRYGIVDATIRLVAMHSFNTVFRVDSSTGRFALRIGDRCRIHPPEVEDTEAVWLAALGTDGFGTAQVVPTTTGGHWTAMDHPGVPDPRVCTLFTWVRGRDLRASSTANQLVAAGRLLGRLHEHTAELGLARPPELEARQAIYFAAQDLVATHAHQHHAVFANATARVQESIDELWATATTTPQLLHGDFGPHNVLHYRGQLVPIDFQDLRVGFPEQDLGITITDLSASDPEFTATFLSGYRQIRDLPDLSPPRRRIHQLARSLNIMNLALHAPHTRMSQAFDQHAARVVEVMAQG